MSVNYDFSQVNVKVKFKSKADLEKRVRAFTKEVEDFDEAYTEGSSDIKLGAFINTDYKKLEGEIFIENGEEYCDTDALAEVICKHFPTANGSVGWACAEVSGGGFVRFASGGDIRIVNGKILSVENELRSDIRKILKCFKTVLGNNPAPRSIKRFLDKYKDK